MKAFYLLLAMVPLTLAAARYAPPPPPCECAQVKCPGEQPALCKCLNSAAIACARKCGGKPIITKCPTPSKPSNTTPTPIPGRNPICGGLRGIQCPEKGQVCVDNPFVENCLIAADCPGICIGPTSCGGIAPFPCPVGQVCLENPNDGCDIFNGGADCSGLCAIKEPRRSDLP